MQTSTADRLQHQRAIQAKCVHPTGTFLPFAEGEVEHSLPARFEQQVRRHPARLAVKTPHAHLTYAALNQAANRVAHALLTHCGPGEAPVALLLDHDPAVIAALLGVLKAGKLYVPLDPSFPPARHTAILQDAQPELLLTDRQHLAAARALSHPGCPVLNLDDFDAAAASENPGLALSPDTLANIVYTSGSTGRPKGVVQTHRYLLHKVMVYTNDIHICPDDRLTLLHSCSVGASERNCFGALLNGAALFPFDVRAHGPAELAAWVRAEAITVLHIIPSAFRQFIETLHGQEPFPALRLIQLGGARVTRRDVEDYQRHFAPHCILLHNLSSTETGTMGRYFIDQTTVLSGQIVPAGYPPTDTEVLLLDAEEHEVGGTGVGEIAVKSRYLALGYWRQPELTCAAFLPDPAGGATRLYRTGDLGHRGPDGCLEHLERQDFQVQIRGHRVEVAEIETVLHDHAAVKEVLVLGHAESAGETRLVAYVVPVQSPGPSSSELQRLVRAKLPAYMVPSTFVWLDALPLTPNGKVDRQALPAPDGRRPALATPYVAPRTPLEITLVRLWTEVLHLEHIGVLDPFLELGGHSLLAMRLIARLHDALQIDVPVRPLLEAATVAEMAIVLTQHMASQQGVEAIEPFLAALEELSDDEVQHRLD